MSCYAYIKTEVLLANLMAAHGKESLYFYNELQEITKSLADATSGYVYSDFSMSIIQKCIDCYPKLFCWVVQDGKIYVGTGEKKPNLEYFNLLYLLPEDSKHIEDVLSGYPSSNKHNQTGRVTNMKLENDGTVDGICLDIEKYDRFQRKLSINQ